MGGICSANGYELFDSTDFNLFVNVNSGLAEGWGGYNKGEKEEKVFHRRHQGNQCKDRKQTSGFN